jgi:uncharacterized protein YndB with AHSA1/START domain
MAEIRDDGSVRFDRQLEVPPDELWLELTDSDRLAAWMAPGEVEPREGGRLEMRFDGDATVTGEVVRWRPPAELEYTWQERRGTPARVRWELEPAERGTRVRLTISQLEKRMQVGFGAGWHAYLDVLGSHLRGAGVDWVERWRHWLPRYEAVVGVPYAGAEPPE